MARPVHSFRSSSHCFFSVRPSSFVALGCTSLRLLRRSIDEDVMIQLVVAFVLSRIDYCNSVLAALPRSTIEPLQRVQNAAARLVFGLRSHDHITPALAQLHWLLVQFRIKFKLCLIHVGRCPAYLTELVSSSAEKLSSIWSAFNKHKHQRLLETQTAYKIRSKCLLFLRTCRMELSAE